MSVRMEFTFAKKGTMRFISHLDLMRLFMRAVRRAGLPVKMSEGFSPHPRLSMKRALKLGVESDNEEAAFVLREQVAPGEFRDKLQKQLPEGIYIREAYSQER
ncbi:MAG: TIGR03936 family radical SAM-associated protein [Candidatus Omnitrophota bacterium]